MRQAQHRRGAECVTTQQPVNDAIYRLLGGALKSAGSFLR